MTAISRDGKVEFRFFRPDASHVNVAGDFNGWKEQGMSMRPDGEGWWVAVAELPPGEYRFRYLADGRWFTDFAANGVEASPAGWNGVLVVPGEIAAAVHGAMKGEAGRGAKDSRN
jgi:1,4-alpha-glucan branching enzyme